MASKLAFLVRFPERRLDAPLDWEVHVHTGDLQLPEQGWCACGDDTRRHARVQSNYPLAPSLADLSRGNHCTEA